MTEIKITNQNAQLSGDYSFQEFIHRLEVLSQQAENYLDLNSPEASLKKGLENYLMLRKSFQEFYSQYSKELKIVKQSSISQNNMEDENNIGLVVSKQNFRISYFKYMKQNLSMAEETIRKLMQPIEKSLRKSAEIFIKNKSSSYTVKIICESLLKAYDQDIRKEAKDYLDRYKEKKILMKNPHLFHQNIQKLIKDEKNKVENLSVVIKKF